MVTFLIVLIIVSTLIVLATRLSFYLYKSGALGYLHTRRLRRLHPLTVGSVSEKVSDYNSIYGNVSQRGNIGLLLLVFLLVISFILIVMIVMLSAAFS